LIFSDIFDQKASLIYFFQELSFNITLQIYILGRFIGLKRIYAG